MTFLGENNIYQLEEKLYVLIYRWNKAMSNTEAIDYAIHKLAKCLIERDRKKALSIIRSRLNKPFDNQAQQFVWKGWERALNRQEDYALIFQMLNGIEFSEIKKIYQDMKRKKSEILLRDHTQIELSKNYLPTWISLLEIYCNICQDKQ